MLLFTFQGINLVFYMGLIALAYFAKFPPGSKLKDWQYPIEPEWARIMTWITVSYVVLYFVAVGACVSISSLLAALRSNLPVITGSLLQH